MTLSMLPPGQADQAADIYIATLGTDASRRVARSQLEACARILLGMPPVQRPKRIGGRSLHVMLERVPWSAVTPDDACRVRDALLAALGPDGRPRSRKTVGATLGALRGVLRAAGALTVAHLEATRVDNQLATGRSVRALVALWQADDAQALADSTFSVPVDPRRDERGRWASKAGN